MDKISVLKKYFGYDGFRNGQEELIDCVCSGRDALGVMPTGGGKSVCYQVPALLFRGVTIVISPLISLMKDQVAALKSAEIPAAFINSSLSENQMRTVYDRLRRGAYKIVYVAPERLESMGFISVACELEVSQVAVDEAHCVSQWGQDFRPSYLKIADFIDKLPRRPVVAAFTATATKTVRRDILDHLRLIKPHTVVTGFDRPNLFFDVRIPKNKPAALRSLIADRRGKTGIIYCSTRKAVEKVCDDLVKRGFAATRYHAGLEDEERRSSQDEFQNDTKTVMVATNAFGMGIDKSNVGYVIHYNMPRSIEAYYQEAGRAGRDGSNADCILLFSPADIQTAKFLIENGEKNETLSAEERQIVEKQELKRLDDIIRFCRTTDCFRTHILDYFGEEHGISCGNCGNCLSIYSKQDITRHAQMILSCVSRVKDFLGYHVGTTLITHTLMGSVEKRLRELRLNGVKTYGIMSDVPRTVLSDEIQCLIAQGYLRVNPEYGTLELTEKSSDVLFRGAVVTMQVKSVRRESGQKSKKAGVAAPPATDTSGGDTLFNALRVLRTKIAREENVPAYVVFSNATLTDMASRCPQSMPEFLEVNGVGEAKAAKYGTAFLQAIADYSPRRS